MRVVAIDPFLISSLVADTVQITDLYRRPPWPYDPVASSVKFEQSPNVGGAVMITVGEIGFRGASINEAPVVVGFAEQAGAVFVQKALTVALRTLTVSPTFVKFKLLVTSVTTGKDALTKAAVTHVHIDFESPEKVKRVLQDHEASVIPALSVEESKVIKKYSPPSEKREVNKLGAGKSETPDNKRTLVDGLTKCAGLVPLRRNEIVQLAELRRTADK